MTPTDEILCNVSSTLVLVIVLVMVNKLLQWEPPGGSD